MKDAAKIGIYTVINCCCDCDWFQKPSHSGLCLSFTRPCCPKCGGEIEGKVGRLQYRTVKEWFGFHEYTEYIGFLVKGENVVIDGVGS